MVSKAIITRWQRETQAVNDCLVKNGLKQGTLLAGQNSENLSECFEDYPQGGGLFRTYYRAMDFDALLRRAKRSDDDINYLKTMVMPNPDNASREQLDFSKDEAKLWANIQWFVSPEGVAAVDKLADEDLAAKTCRSDRISRSLVAHVTEKSASPFANWWSRKNVENQLSMFACPDQRNGAYNPAVDCFKSFGQPVDIAAAQSSGDGES
ncbi:MAG: hypothetical protein EBU49_09905, partial [Proteobacteria bacterium]|nr:hypothetical protein [Pseudomonadota bacterium]